MSRMADAARWFVILNPVAGGGRARRRWRRLAAALGRHRIPHELVATASAGDAVRLARQAIANGHRRLLTLGGDGTLNEVVNGVAAQDEVPLDQVLIAAAPVGSGNDWAHTLQMPADADRLAGAMARGASRRVDLGIAVAGETGTGTRRLVFHTVAGAGLATEVLGLTPRGGPRAAAYLIGLVRALLHYRAPRFHWIVDGRPGSDRCWVVLAAIGPDCGGGMRLAPSALLDDGLFEFVTIAPMPLVAAVTRLPRLFDGRLARDPAVQTEHCRAVTIHADPPCSVQVDGQMLGLTPVSLRLWPGALRALDCRAPGPVHALAE